ncbi:uncharacterized protein LOC133716426 [Rosa rugosa]|uniref:uncharacterized protein LOC133716426 n=1 Tax=Rosa rugosa TaxID=74645 RepID=UPI002B40731D|nr:uncharacterized protein LOC133716426 [Rosa rugosa]
MQKAALLWRDVQGSLSLNKLANNWFRLEFSLEDDLLYVLDERPWYIKGRIFHVQRWFPGFDPLFTRIQHLVVWIRLPNLPLHYYDPKVLEDAVMPLGKFIKLDEATTQGSQCIFARVCLEIDIRHPLTRILVIHTEDDLDDPVSVRVSYEGLFVVCFQCGSHKHKINTCPFRVREEDFILVDRFSDDDEVEPSEKELAPEIKALLSDKVMAVFPQPNTSVIRGQGPTESFAEQDRQDDINPISPNWTLVTRKRTPGAKSFTGKQGNGRATIGTRSLPTPNRSGLVKDGISFKDATRGGITIGGPLRTMNKIGNSAADLSPNSQDLVSGFLHFNDPKPLLSFSSFPNIAKLYASPDVDNCILRNYNPGSTYSPTDVVEFYNSFFNNPLSYSQDNFMDAKEDDENAFINNLIAPENSAVEAWDNDNLEDHMEVSSGYQQGGWSLPI